MASKSLQRNLEQQNDDSVSVDPTGNVQAASTASGEDNVVGLQQITPAPTPSGSCGSPPLQDAQPQQQQHPQKQTTEGEQQRLLQQQTWNKQLTRQTRLENQQEELHDQQQQLVHELQLQQDEKLLEGLRELQDQQQKLVQQHAEQQQLFVQQAEELQQLRSWAPRRETPEKPRCNQEEQTSCPAEPTDTEINPEQEPLGGSGPPARTGSCESSQTPAAEENFLTPVEEGCADDEDYTCV